jgi:hypothetical protein
MWNKKGGLASTLFDILLVIILLGSTYIIYKNFHTTCVLNNLKLLTFDMKNCIRL